jgi:ABC-type molybdate transport system substrate-binding protein
VNWAKRAFLFSALAAGVLVTLLVWRPGESANEGQSHPLLVYCAAGLKPPVESIARRYEHLCRVPVRLQYGGSGALLSNLRVAGQGDLYLAGDASYLQLARSNGLVAETISLARLGPTLAVKRGNPKNIRSLADLTRADLAVGLANPDAAAVGKVTRDLLVKSGQWDALRANAKVLKPTVTDLANDLKLGALDAGIVWDATVNTYPELEAVRCPELALGEQEVAVGVLSRCSQPAAALRFARYLGARDQGLLAFAQAGYRVVPGDSWTERPQVVLYSGALNRVAIEPAVQQFEKREGVQVTRVYNGCGILVAQMKAGQQPDAYLACDVSYLVPVQESFQAGVVVSETDIVILAAKGNPKRIRALADLGQPGLRVGVANPQQSTLGDLTVRLLRSLGLYDKVMANVKTQTPTADMLVNQIRTGSLDAVVVYEANTSQVRDTMELVRLDRPGAKAAQPYAVSKHSNHPGLMQRLLEAICSGDSRKHYQSLGFRWRAGESSGR